MRHARSVLLGVTLVWISCTTAAQGGGVRFGDVPADATWLMHVDVDRLRGSPAWPLLQAVLRDNAAYQVKVRELEEASAAKYPQDLHGVTLFGRDFSDDGVTLQIHAAASVERILGRLKHNPRYRAFPVHGRQVVSWEDQGRQLYGCFYEADRLVMAWSQKALERALAVIDGREPALKPDSPLAGGLEPADGGVPLAYVACSDVAALRREGLSRSPLLSRVGPAWVGFTAGTTGSVVRGRAHTDSVASAEHLRVAVEGLKAMAVLSDADGRDGAARRRARMAVGLSVRAGGAAAELDWRMDWQALQSLVPVQAAGGRATAATNTKE